MAGPVIPFGLTLLEEVPTRCHPASLSWAVLQQQRQLAEFTGRPLGEQTLEDLLVASSPTETDGKDPIAVDTDPVYD